MNSGQQEVREKLSATSSIEKFYTQQWGISQKTEEAQYFLLFFAEAIQHSYCLLGPLSGKKVLEIGCGSGQQAMHFVQQGAEVTAIDIADTSITSLRSLAATYSLKNFTIIKMNAEQLEFPAQSFDCVYINSTLMHVAQEKVIQECSRVLKEGGRLIILEPLQHNPMLKLYRFFSRYRKMHPTYMTVARFRSFQKQFRSMQHKEFYGSSVLALPLFHLGQKKLALLFFRFLSRFDSFLLQLFPFLGGFFWVSVVRYEK